jgi:hypothetical protein
MISGVAQVMGMKPIFRSFFSSGALSWAMACSAPMGSTLAMAARAVLAPTAFRKPRRTLSTGNSALTRLASMKSLRHASASGQRGGVGLRRVVLAAGCSAASAGGRRRRRHAGQRGWKQAVWTWCTSYGRCLCFARRGPVRARIGRFFSPLDAND